MSGGWAIPESMSLWKGLVNGGTGATVALLAFWILSAFLIDGEELWPDESRWTAEKFWEILLRGEDFGSADDDGQSVQHPMLNASQIMNSNFAYLD